MTKYKRIQKLCKQRGVSVAKMERDLGFARGSVAKIDDHKPSIDRVSKICLYLQVSPMALLVDEESDEKERSEAVAYADAISNDTTPTVDIPIYEVSAGQGRTSPPPEKMPKEEGDFAKVVGDSMLPTLHNGDVVRIVETTSVEPKDIALVRINGDELTLKHIEVTADGLWVRGENKDAFKDRFFTMQEVITLPVQVVGKAVELVSRKL